MTPHLTCTECGATGQRTDETHTSGKLGETTIDFKGHVRIREVACAYCGAEGELFEQLGLKGGTTVKVREGPFVELSDEGLQTLRANLDDPAFEPIEQ